MGISAADWVTTEDVFLLRHSDQVKWNTGVPVWHHYTVGSKGEWTIKKYEVKVTLKEIG